MIAFDQPVSLITVTDLSDVDGCHGNNLS